MRAHVAIDLVIVYVCVCEQNRAMTPEEKKNAKSLGKREQRRIADSAGCTVSQVGVANFTALMYGRR